MFRTRVTLFCVATVVLLVAGRLLQAQAPPGREAVDTEAAFEPSFFPILPWDRVHGRSAAGGIDGIAACGFTIAGFVQPEDLPQCEQLGLKAILAPPKGRSPFTRDGWRDLSDADIDAYVRTMVESSRQSAAVIGYFIVDEPGTPAFPALAKAVAAVRRYAPGKLAYINLFPGYATIGAPDDSQLGAGSFTEYLERYVREVRPQFISYDNYMVQYSDDLQNAAAAAAYFRDLLEVRRVAMEHGLPFWNIVSSNQIRPETPPPSPANLLLQAYTTLAAGGRGLSWYTYYSRSYGYAPIDKEDHQTESWDYLHMVNKQVGVIGPVINRLRSTGVFFATPPPVDSGAVLPGRVIHDVRTSTSLRRQSETDLSLMVGEFVGPERVDYALIVNLSLSHSINIKPEPLKDDCTISIISPMDARPVPYDPQRGRWLVAGQGALLRLEHR